MGSFRQGAVYEVNMLGEYRKIIEDKQLNSVLAVRVDTKRNRLLVVNSDIGNSIRSYEKGAKKLAAVVIYQLDTGQLLHSVNLGSLMPNTNHLGNGMTLDDKGNAYITDSFASVIYKVDTDGNPSVFSRSKLFEGNGITLNGIVYHPDGYLIVVKKDDGQLFKISLDAPNNVTKIKTEQKFIGGDGLVLTHNHELVVIANRASGHVIETVYLMTSYDNWKCANKIDEYKFGKVYINLVA